MDYNRTSRIRKRNKRLYYRKRRSGILRYGLLLLAVLLVLALKFWDTPPVSEIREFVSINLGSGEQVIETVKTIGREVLGKDGLWGLINNAAVRVFGPRVKNGEKAADTGNTSKTSSETQSLPTIKPNVFDEIAPESTGDTMSAGAFLAMPLIFRKTDELNELKAASFAKYGSGLSETVLPESVRLLAREAPEEKRSTAVPAAAKLTQPVKEETITENTPGIVDNKTYKIPFPYSCPLKGPITSDFGERSDPFRRGENFHHGVDIGAPKGTAIKSFAVGKVIAVGSNSVYGRYLRIDHGSGFTSFYGHCNRIVVKSGSKIKLGQKIAEAGNTGRSTGTHLHFELRRNGLIINPSKYVKFS